MLHHKFLCAIPLAVLFLFGCRETTLSPPENRINKLNSIQTSEESSPKERVVGDAIIELSNVKLMAELEKAGLSFSEQVESPDYKGKNNDFIYEKPFYRSIVASLEQDLLQKQRQDPLLSVTMAKSHRLFDIRWLKSSAAFFELVGVINRMDRQPFGPKKCGEVRLIYRLAYKKKKLHHEVYSRLPLTVNVVHWLNPDTSGCSDWGKRWAVKRELKALIGNQGPFDPARLNMGTLKSIELNLQAIRWPSTIRPDMGGYAEYFLRVFKRSNTSYVLGAMENMPDIELLRANPTLKNELLEWILSQKNLQALDAGIATIPEKFLAKKATSFALHGMDRLSNRPFDQLFSIKDFENVDTTSLKLLKSPVGILRRLNGLSCVGCHQGRTVAGFHFLGIDREDTHPVNAISVPSSPHFLGDLPRRKDFVNRVARGEVPNPERPFAERTNSELEGGFGSHCGLGDKSFVSWHCKEGFTCRAYDAQPNAVIGECVPNFPTAGSPCEVGMISQKRKPLSDRIKSKRFLSCGDRMPVCETTRVGFPGGMCSGGCTNLNSDERCGRIAILGGFNRCLSTGIQSFSQCLTDNIRPGALRGCDRKNPCRDDYICARAPEDPRGGVCIPPYFLFQLRVDGHPRP